MREELGAHEDTRRGNPEEKPDGKLHRKRKHERGPLPRGLRAGNQLTEIDRGPAYIGKKRNLHRQEKRRKREERKNSAAACGKHGAEAEYPRREKKDVGPGRVDDEHGPLSERSPA